jgi:regulator of RNase E activity RraA
MAKLVQTEWSSDQELFDLIERELYTPVIGDILDTYGMYHRFLPAGIRPLRESMRVTGWAMPVLTADVFERPEAAFGLLTEALDNLLPGEIYIAAGAGHRSAAWGEILTATAKMRGARGAILDGYHRDTSTVLGQSFPVFSRGAYGQDAGPRMRVAGFRVPIEIEAVSIHPGDLVVGDVDGVVVVPVHSVDDVIAAALEKARAEKTVRRAIENGMSATEAFRRFGVL